MERRRDQGKRVGDARQVNDLERLVRLLARAAAAEYVRSRGADPTVIQDGKQEIC